jgi:hypothetical protein
MRLLSILIPGWRVDLDPRTILHLVLVRKLMIAWFEEQGWPRTAEIGSEFVSKMRSRNYASLKIHCHNMPDETRMSVPRAVISRGLRYAFNHWEP